MNYIGEASFGQAVDVDEFILESIKLIPKKLGKIDTKLIMTDLHDMKFGIFNHRGASKQRPLSSVEFHPCEDLNADSLLEESMRVYIQTRIKDNFGLDYLEYLELPMDVTASLRKISTEENAKRNKIASEIEDQLDIGKQKI